MSGFEIAGLVLGAIPVTISAVDQYREVAKRFNFYTKIAVEHAKCLHELDLQLTIFKQNLRLLLLPLDIDKVTIDALINDPGGPSWEDPAIEESLRARLLGSFDSYIPLVEEINEVAWKLEKELAVDPAHRLSEMTRRRKVEKEFRKLYKLKFSNSEGLRNELLSKLVQYNSAIDKLLRTSDKVAEAEGQRTASTAKKGIDSMLVTFWKQATALFNALASAWNCHCSGQHCANLLLEHRKQATTEFVVLFPVSQPSQFLVRETKIVRRANEIAHSNSSRPPEAMATAVRQPGHRLYTPLKSAMMKSRASGKSVSTRTCVQLREKHTPSITISTLSSSTSLQVAGSQISSLCSSICKNFGSADDCYGFLCDEAARYYLYPIVKSVSAPHTVTLDQVLRGEPKRPTRKQRYGLALNLASSLLQLLESPWLPLFQNRSDVTFFSQSTDKTMGWLDRPHIGREFCGASNRDGRLYDSFALLGIVLLELCFGQTLADHPRRKQLSPGHVAGANSKVEKMLDLGAAQEWAEEVEEEAGQAYQGAVDWCLTRSRASAKGPERWREEMVNEVVKPLEACCRHFN